MLTLPARHTGPGLVDLQLNGYAGFDFNGDPAGWTPDAFHRVRAALLRRGVVRALPTFITDALDRLLARARAYARLVDADDALRIAFPGLHVEGPFLSAEDGPRGAHPLRHCLAPADAPDLVDRIDDASGGRLRLFTLAPELDGSLDLIRRLASRNVCVALGHTAADADTLDRAVRAGARLSTHLGNGSHQTLPRLDNYVQRQLADDRLFASFIADGHHIPFPTLRNFIRAKTPARTTLVTDAISAADAGPGRYRLGEEEVVVSEDGVCRKPGQPNLAGSALTLDRAVVNVARHTGVSFAEAWTMASTRPAALVGLDTPESVTVDVTPEGFTRR